ncbi:hypothetical protein TH53_23630 [Pedobacter lusitanus]|uniref:Uncharacterized protein n=1 Tax=Pedobacter lusitanus TaxID=1503925 RepID=A0A0D0GC91_9SPHI|nr:hypothetical protein [Pedobacter lusitanus]KIO74922.1 hypothetical protein TH53_23630 [Pedobacter lusitanus]
MNTIFNVPSKKAKKEALNHPNGYVYVINEAYSDKKDVPPEAIAGAWKVNENGLIEGDFIPNPKYLDKSLI